MSEKVASDAILKERLFTSTRLDFPDYVIEPEAKSIILYKDVKIF
jgi:hypothetical protein